VRKIGFFNFKKTVDKVAKGANSVRRKIFDGFFSQQTLIAPTMNTADFLRSYGEIGWLFVAVNRISQDIGSSEWKAYKGDEVQENSLALNVLKHPNRFMSQYQLLWKSCAYLELTGRCFWYIAKDGIGRPKEIWCLNPLDIWVVPDRNNFIKGYMYKAGAEQIPLDVDEVIFINLPDLLNPYSGKGPAQAAASNLEIDKYTSTYVKNFFYNDARPGGIVNFPDMEENEYDRAVEQYKDKHRGVENSSEILFTKGGSVSFTPININIKDLDISNLKDNTRDGILGAFGVPKSIVGITDDVNRSTAEAAEYTFAMHTIKPLLHLVQDVLNNEFVPLFKEDSELKFTDPVPKNKDFVKSVLDTQIDKSLTKNEVRDALNKLMGWNLPHIEGGDVIYQPVGLQPLGTPMPTASSNNNSNGQPQDPQKSIKKKLQLRLKAQFDNLDKEAYWKSFVAKTDKFEKDMQPVWKGIFDKQKDKIITNLKTQKHIKDISINDILDFLNGKAESDEMQSQILSMLKKIMQDKGDQVMEELNVDTSFNLHDPKVTIWLENYCGDQITNINSTTKDLIKKQLVDGQNNGESIPKLCDRISQYFDDMQGYRVERIARTEVIGASNNASLLGYKQSGVVEKKQWLTAIDERTREWHIEADGQTVGIDEKFIVDGEELDCPGDAGGSPENVVNCRCTIVPSFDTDNSGKNDTKDDDSDIMDIEQSIRDDIRSGQYPLTINEQAQNKHIPGTNGYKEGRSILSISIEEAQELVNKYAGTGTLIMVNDKWKDKERILSNDKDVGIYKENGTVIGKTKNFMIYYNYSDKKQKIGTHIVPAKP
jgi:HK97 family phage portal protein